MTGPVLDRLLADVAAAGPLGLDLAAAAWQEHYSSHPGRSAVRAAGDAALVDCDQRDWTAEFDDTLARVHTVLPPSPGHPGHHAVKSAAVAATAVDLGDRTGLTADHIATLTAPWRHAARVHALLRAQGAAAEAVAATLLADGWHAPLDTLPGTVHALLTA